MKNFSPLLLLRFVIAGIFVVSGIEKLLSPYENFLYVIQNYDVVPWAWAEELVARIFPWIELIAGIFLLLGLWTRWALWSVAAMSTSFICIVGQAIVRALPIQSCGCFGELVKVPLPVIIAFDSAILLSTLFMLKYLQRTNGCGLDKYFDENG